MKPNIQLIPKQKLAYDLLMDHKTKDIAYGGAAGGGKSWLGNVWLLMMSYAYPGTKYFIGRKQLGDILGSTFLTWEKVCEKYKIPRSDWGLNSKYNYIQLFNSSRIDFLELKFRPKDDPRYHRLGSKEYTCGWIEEGGEIHFRAYDILKSRVGRQYNDKYNIKGKILITCNPEKNWLKTEFYNLWEKGTLPCDRAFIQSLVDDNGFIEKEYVENLDGLSDEATRERLRKGNWNYADEPDQIIPYNWTEIAMDTPIVKGGKYGGVDVARFGDDLSSIARIEGNDLVSLKTRGKSGVDQVVEWVTYEVRSNRVNADQVGVDVVGIGGGVVDYLRKGKINVRSIQSGGKAEDLPEMKEYTFKNLRSQMWWAMREAMRPDSKDRIRIGNIPNREELVEDLTAVKYKISSGGVVEVESKETIKERLGRSTDYADPVVYANWMRYRDKHKGKPGYFGYGNRTEW